MDRFSNRLVRDLAWVIASPPLVSGNFNDTHWWNSDDCEKEFKDCLPALIALDKNPIPLIEHLNKLKSGRLGFRFESFVAYWITISPNFELIAQNLQITVQASKGSHTYGEIDFIIKNTHTNQIIHLEVAVKFYLGSAPYEDPYRWFGTNTNDQLGKKVEHLKQHQTQLSDKYTAYLKERGYTIECKQCFIKGRLFYPSGITTSPQGTAPNHLRGKWEKSPIATDDYLYPLDKKDWLAKLNHNDLLTRKPCRGSFKIERAQCMVHATNEQKEVERVFCLPEDFNFPEC